MKARVFKLYDSLSRKVKEVKPLEKGHLRFYACGPTVYSYAHIGNFRSFLTADLIIRTAQALGLRTTFVSNITDVGHLTDDDVADAGGEDRMEKALHSKEGEQFNNIWDLARHYTQAMERDWQLLNMRPPDVRPRATEHIREQILAIEELIAKGHAYETSSGIYFHVPSFAEYGKLSGNKADELNEAERTLVKDPEKKDPRDFALWKKDDKHLMQWYSPWGWGFPGWHIECTAMSMKYLGDSFDIHSGGEDNAFPHHECEIAQSESLTGKPFAQHWVHTRFLQVNSAKMAKRVGNITTVSDLVEDGYDPLAVRYALISGIYGKPLNFTDQSLKDASQNIERFKAAWDKVSASSAGEGGGDRLPASLDRLYSEALDAMCSDLNTAVALAKALEGARAITREPALTETDSQAARAFLDKINSLLGIVRHEDPPCGFGDDTLESRRSGVDEAWIEAKISERAARKAAKDYAAADAIRLEIEGKGVELRDTPDGTTWKVKAGT
ncbi:MAG: cysteine--tRNA ligase [Fimbriimonadaceae bacterium]